MCGCLIFNCGTFSLAGKLHMFSVEFFAVHGAGFFLLYTWGCLVVSLLFG